MKTPLELDRADRAWSSGCCSAPCRRGSATGCASRRVQAASTIGGLWLDALKMTVIPLIVALLVTGIVAGADQPRRAASPGGRSCGS